MLKSLVSTIRRSMCSVSREKPRGPPPPPARPAAAPRPRSAPRLAPRAAFDIFAAVFVESANVRLEPGIEDGDPHLLQEVAHSVAPAGLLFRRARQHKIHRPGQIYPGAAEQVTLTF